MSPNQTISPHSHRRSRGSVAAKWAPHFPAGDPSRPHFAAFSMCLAVLLVVGASSPLALAADKGVLQTASVKWDSADSDTAIWTGGAPVDFEREENGWRGAPFNAIGKFGLAMTFPGVDSRRVDYVNRNETTTIEQGVIHTMELDNRIIIDGTRRAQVQPTITAEGSSLRFDIDFADERPNSISSQRVYLHVDFAAGDTIVYDDSVAQAIIAADSSDEKSLVVLHVDSDDGDAVIGGRALHTDPLEDGDPEATAYVRNITGASLNVTVHAFVIDYDPCAKQAALDTAEAIAADPTSWFGEVIRVHSECVSNTTWEYTSGGEEAQTISLALDNALSDPEGTTRRYSIEGLPSFLSSSIDLATEPATLSLTSRSEETTGTYPLTLRSWRETPSGETTLREAPLISDISLTVAAPPPPPEPEVEPEPERGPKVEPEPETPPVSRSDKRSSSKGDDDSEALIVPLTPAMPAPLPAPLPAPVTPESVDDSGLDAEDTPEPDFQLQDSGPTTPLPESPELPEASEVAAPPELNLWGSFWWVWVAAGGGLISWAVFFAWKRRREPQRPTY